MSSRDTVKLSRIRAYLEEQNYSGLLLLRQDNFAWLTDGGTNRVIIPSAEGAAALVVTQNDVFLVARAVDGMRIMEEELVKLFAEYVPVYWDGESVLDKSLLLAGPKPAADIQCTASYVLEDIYDLHYPLLDNDIAALNEAGQLCDSVLSEISKIITPETLEIHVEAMLLNAFARQSAACDVIFVGGQSRVFRYRHPLPTRTPIGRHVLITPSVRVKGVHCNIARTVYFGDKLPQEILEAHDTVCAASATSTSMSIEGTSYHDIFCAYRKTLKKRGFAGQWKQHYPGGRTGYMVCQPHFSLNPDRRIGSREAYEWFATVPGAKAAELIVKDGEHVYNASASGRWPMQIYSENGMNVILPNIMMR